MGRQKKWPNEEMWQQAVSWRRGGLTYSEICGQFSKDENMKRFSLKGVPSEDTVRREVNRRLDKRGQKNLGEANDPLRRVREKATLRHISRLSELAKELEAQLLLPRPSDGGSWAPPHTSYAAIPLSTETYALPPLTPLWRHLWELGKQRPGTLRLTTETDQRWFERLKSHVPDAQLWDSFDKMRRATL